MSSDGKKISFGFSKISKKPNVLAPTVQEKKSVELIDCLEGSEIKVKNAVEKIVKAPLVIPVEVNVSKLERRILKSKKIETNQTDEDTRPDSELTIEELAARQLLKEARNKLMQSRDTVKVHTVPIEESSTVEDIIESSLGDYESVPIEDFGLAYIRGLGWKEGMSVGKNQAKFVEPDRRPKLLGLGAQNILDLHKNVDEKDDEMLFLTKGAYAKIIAGPHMGKFCEVHSTDEWSRVVTVKIHSTNEVITLNELLVVPIAKETYERESKVINNAKYEQYKIKDKYIEVASNNKNSEDKSNTRFDSEELHTERVKVENVSPENDLYEETKSISSLKHKTAKHEKEYRNNRNRSRERTTRKKLSSRSSDSSDGNEHERNKMKSNRKHSGRKDEAVLSEESSEEHSKRRRKNRSRSRSRSSSTEYYKKSHKEKKIEISYSDEEYKDKKFSSKNKNERHSHRKKSKKNHSKNRDSSESGGRSRARSSCSGSDEEYKDRKSSRKDKKNEHSSNRRKQKNRRKDRDSSESDYSEKKSRDYRNKYKTEKYKSRY